MAYIRNCIFVAVVLFCIAFNAKAQTVYYPARASQLLKATAEDAAMLLQKAVTGSRFTTQAYTTVPSEGIVFLYDSSITDNQACKVESNGLNLIKFSAFQDNGLHFGIYQYLHQLGFRFYQPGSIWEITPALSSAYSKIDTVFTTPYKYKSWSISGGHRRWIMDNNIAFDWDNYTGENGHNWALYQRRNGMLGALGFRGHRGDIMTGNYLTTLKNNPCFVANNNGSRQASVQSVPDFKNSAATDLWANTIEQKYTQERAVILNNPTLYTNTYRNLDYTKYIGIEVADGARWGNSKENEVCDAVDYPKESDQHFIVANNTAQKILTKYADAHFQLYAYSAHADVPSPAISINKNIDIQMISSMYQFECSANGLRNRWYNRSTNISEYQYLNLSNWSGETPSFNWDELKASLQVAKDKKSQGLVWEASPAKFGSLPYLLAANNSMANNIEVDSTLHEFCNTMFAGAANTIYNMMQLWGNENEAPNNRYSIQLYLQQMNTAVQQTQSAPEVVKDRLRELKAYIHYMVMYFNLANNDMDKSSKTDRDAALCMYLAKTNKLQLVNSYYMIKTIVSKYASTSEFYTKYNVVNGTAYQNGILPLITAAEIDSDFLADFSNYGTVAEQFVKADAGYIKAQFNQANLEPLAKINTKIGYTNGAYYYSKATFNIIAPAAGSFSIQYTPTFDMEGKGYINFVVERTDKALEIIKDFTINNNSATGTLTVNVPAAGTYLLTMITKNKSAVDLSITTNGNYFYKEGVFLGSKIETYKTDTGSLPGYFYIPAGIKKIYFAVNNSFWGGKYASAETIAKSFDIKDNNGNSIKPRFVTPKDSSLFYLEIPATANGTFWQATKGDYMLQFVNISNVLWYAQRKTCTSSSFTISVVNEKGNCITRLTTTAASANLTWEVSDMGKVYKYTNLSVIDLPDYVSPNAVITLTNAGGCNFVKSLKSDAGYLRAKEACASGAAIGTGSGVLADAAAAVSSKAMLYPNPSNGVFNCSKNGSNAIAQDIIVFNSQGIKVGNFKNVRQFNISNVTPGVYLYQMTINGEVYKGKVIKI